MNPKLLHRWIPVLACIALCAGYDHAGAQTTWNGNGGDNLWGTGANWSGGAPSPSSTTDIAFGGTNRLNSVYNYGDGNAFRNITFNSDAGAFHIYTTNSNNSNSTTDNLVGISWYGSITNNSTNTQTLGIRLYLQAGDTVNAAVGDIVLNGDIFKNGNSLTFIDSNTTATNSVTVNSIIQDGGSGGSAGKVTIGTSSNPVNVIFNANNTYTAGTDVNYGKLTIVGDQTGNGQIVVSNSGTLQFGNGGSTGSASNAGTIFVNNSGIVAINKSDGGSVSNQIASNPSATTTLLGLNASGTTNSFTGTEFSNGGSFIVTSTNSGATLSFTNTQALDVKSTGLTVNGAGNTTFSGALYSSNAAGGYLYKDGAGTLLLSNSNNSYTGTSSGSLNANGTQINQGVVAITSDTSLGLAPAGAYNNIQFLGSGTLQDFANNISLASTRNISVANGVTATFDSNGNTFTINGSINGSGNINKTGAGTVVLTNSNSYFGTTTVSGGTLKLANASGVAIAGGGDVFVNRGGTLLFGGNNQINQAVFQPITVGGGAGTPQAKIDAGGFSQGTGGTPAIPSSGTVGLGALTMSSSSIIDLTSTSVLHFADSSAKTWTGTLSIYDWTGSNTGGGAEQILFGQTTTGLTAGQLTQVQFYSDAGSTALGSGALILADGEIIPNLVAVPEPSTCAGATLALLAMAYSQRRRIRRLAAKI